MAPPHAATPPKQGLKTNGMKQVRCVSHRLGASDASGNGQSDAKAVATSCAKSSVRWAIARNASAHEVSAYAFSQCASRGRRAAVASARVLERILATARRHQQTTALRGSAGSQHRGRRRGRVCCQAGAATSESNKPCNWGVRARRVQQAGLAGQDRQRQQHHALLRGQARVRQVGECQQSSTPSFWQL